MKMTAAALKRLKPRDKRYDASLDERGLWARVYPSGRIAIQYLYLAGSVRRRITLGYYPDMSIEALKRVYLRERALRSEGRDPQRERLDERDRLAQEAQKAKLAKTVTDLGRQFVEDYSKREKRAQSAREDQRILEKEIIPVIGKLPIEQVQRSQLVELIERITRRGSPVMANRVRAFLSKLFNWAVDRCVLEGSPATHLPMNKETIRQRVLDDSDLKAFWNAIDTLPNPVHQAAVRILLLTGQRRSEVARLARDEINSEWWTILEGRAKNGVAHRVPLSPLACKSIKGSEVWVFPSQAASHVHPDTLTDIVPKIAALAGIKHCTTHDLRRTVGTFIQRKFGAEVIHKTLNHKDDRLTATYGLYGFDKEKRAALLAWARHIEEVLSGKRTGEVVNISERRA